MVRKEHSGATWRSAAAGSPLRARLAFAALMGSTALAALPSTALAACVNTGGSDSLCSGAETTGLVVNADNATVTTAAGFSVDSGADTALEIEGNGALSYADGFTSSLSGDGGLYIHSNGDAGATAGSVTVFTYGTITGSQFGIDSRNSGSGATEIMSFGQVTSLNGIGISAVNAGAATTDLTIEAANVSARYYGIDASNFGTGATAITTTGAVNGWNTQGINVFNATTATDLTIEAVDVSGGGSGIFAENLGTGATSITASGDVEGTEDYGD
jgi:autotransporter family porin